jgi:hypothetical protein
LSRNRNPSIGAPTATNAALPIDPGQSERMDDEARLTLLRRHMSLLK